MKKFFSCFLAGFLCLGSAQISHAQTAPPTTLLVIGQSDRTTLGRGVVSEDVLKTLGQYPQPGKASARDIPGSKLVELTNVGHIPHLESPNKFHIALLDFLQPKQKLSKE